MAPRKNNTSALYTLIGARLRDGRTLRRLSQEKLAKLMGVSFQQIQKYEAGTNRLPIEALLRAMAVLDLPWKYFLSEAYKQERPKPFADERSVPLKGDERALIGAFAGINSGTRRKQLIGLVRVLAESANSVAESIEWRRRLRAVSDEVASLRPPRVP